ncbi:ABC transporter permease [Devriesea agamarum]|uniref:ABC transporter permease n=1 Tax=Devriesea agamarum TaxID=472569 RepID=UPI00071C56A0|nr:ABC transporter permease [Devriesea agamarum]
MSRFGALTRVLLRYDIRDWSNMIFTFLVPAGLLVVLVLAFHEPVKGVDLTGPISANVLAFGAAFVGVFAGATHLALWRENGMLTVLRSFPISSNTVISAQAIAGVVMLLMQAAMLFIVAIVMGMRPDHTAPLALLPMAFGYLLFFVFGVIIGVVIPSMAAVSMGAMLVVIPLGYVGGATIPVEALPLWVQMVAPYTPIYHIREAVTMLLIGEGSWLKVGIGIAYLVVMTAVLSLFAQRLMKWK